MPYTPVNTLPTQLLNQRPIGFADDIASLGNLIDAIQVRRQQQANSDREFELKQQRLALDDQKAAELDARTMRGQRVQWSRENQKALADAQGQAATGLPNSFVHVDDQGNPQIVTPTYEAPPAAPAPMDEGPQDINTMLAEFGQPTISSTSPSQVRGAQYSLPPIANMDALSDAELEARTKDAQMREQPAARRVRIPIPGQEPIVVDQGQVREDAQRQASFEVSNLQQALQDPNLTEGAKRAIEASIAAKRGMLPTKMQQTVLAQAGSTDRNLDTIGARTATADADRASRESIANSRNETSIKIAEMRKKKGGAKAAAKATDPSAGSDNPWAMLDSKERTREGNRMNRELRDWTNMHGWTKLISTNVGRLDWAKENIALTGPGAGAAHVEAMQNLFGIARGGTPVKNETDEFYKGTNSLKTMLNDLGPKIGIPGLGAKLSMGKLTPEEEKQYAAGVSAMPEERRAAIARAIQSTSDALMRYGRKEIQTLKALWDNEPLANRYKATSFINEMAAHLDMKPQQWWKDVPLKGNSAPAGGGIDAKLEALGKMLGGGQ